MTQQQVVREWEWEGNAQYCTNVLLFLHPFIRLALKIIEKYEHGDRIWPEERGAQHLSALKLIVPQSKAEQ